MKYVLMFLFCLIPSLLMASNVENRVLPNMVKEQGGVYYISTNGTNNVLENSGFVFEFFNPGERLLLDGSRLDVPFFFGSLFNKYGQYYTVSGVVTGKTASVAISRVSGTNTIFVGSGTVVADPNNVGHSDVLSFSFTASEDVLGLGHKALTKTTSVTLLRASDTVIEACRGITGNGSIKPGVRECYRFNPSPVIHLGDISFNLNEQYHTFFLSRPSWATVKTVRFDFISQNYFLNSPFGHAGIALMVEGDPADLQNGIKGRGIIIGNSSAYQGIGAGCPIPPMIQFETWWTGNNALYANCSLPLQDNTWYRIMVRVDQTGNVPVIIYELWDFNNNLINREVVEDYINTFIQGNGSNLFFANVFSNNSLPWIMRFNNITVEWR